jgi:hypothetical protein
MNYIQVVINFTTFDSKSKKETINLSIPSLGILLQTIKRLIESTNQVIICQKTRWLFHENFFRWVSMNKFTLHIHLMDFPSKLSKKGKNYSNRVCICNNGKGISVVDTFLLIKYLHNQDICMSLNNTFRGKFSPVDPSTLHNIVSL